MKKLLCLLLLTSCETYVYFNPLPKSTGSSLHASGEAYKDAVEAAENAYTYK